MLSHEQLHTLLRESSLEALSFTEGERYKGNTHFASNSLNEVVGFNLEMIEHALSSMNYMMFKPHVNALIAEHKLDIVQDTDGYRMFCREALKYLYDVMKVEQERCKGNYDNDFDRHTRPALIQPHSLPANTVEQNKEPSLLLSAAIESFMQWKEEKKKNTRKNYEGMNKLVLKVLYDKPIDQYTYDDMLNARGILKKIPKNATSTEGWEELSIDEIINLKNAAKPFADSTVEKYLIHISTLFNYFVNERDWLTKSPCPSWETSKKKNRKPKRVPFSNEELAIFFTSPHYRLTTRRYKDPHNFWAPLLGTYGGLRVDEACQLYKTDIKEVDGVWCFDINDDLDKNIKTPSSERRLPVHPVLIDLGFLDYVAAVDHERLFPGLKNDPEEGEGYSHDFDKNINKYIKRNVVDDKKKTFHSTRKCFASNLKRQGEHNDMIGAILGHEADDEVTEDYAGEYNVATKLEAMKKLNFGFDIVELVGKWDPKKCGGKFTQTTPKKKPRKKSK